MLSTNWVTWAAERQNWFLGAFGSALILYIGRGSVSMISKRRKQSIEGSDVPIWPAYTILILSTIIPSIILIAVVAVHIASAIAYAGIWDSVVDIETIAFIIFVATGFLLGLIIWGIMRVIMWVLIDWLARSLFNRQIHQDGAQRNGRGIKFIQNLFADTLKKRLLPDRRLEIAVREALRKQEGRILESDLEGLTKLYAGEKKVIDLSGIEHCTNLQSLNVYDNQLRDIAPLSNLTNLQELVLTAGGIRDIKPLSNLTKLRRLRMGSNLIVDIRSLSGLVDLQELYLWNNQISSISPLSNLTNLQRLGLGNNQIINISPLKGLDNLQELVLADNWIEDVTDLSNLTNLKGLYLARNYIRDISPLVRNSGIGEGTVVNLMGNPLNSEAYDIHIPALQERGVRVRYSPKP